MDYKSGVDFIKTKDDEKTFYRLKELQTLLKKESALNELCKI